MIKVPGTKAGVPAIRQLIGEGINVNVTLLFGVDAYLDVAEALHRRPGGRPRRPAATSRRIHGVASFFVSRIDTKIDKAIDARLDRTRRPTRRCGLKRVRGKVAHRQRQASPTSATWRSIATPRWKALAGAGAAPQRLLWASTGVKDPAYPDTLYVDDADRPRHRQHHAAEDHGRLPRPRRTSSQSLTDGVAEAEHDPGRGRAAGPRPRRR